MRVAEFSSTSTSSGESGSGNTRCLVYFMILDFPKVYWLPPVVGVVLTQERRDFRELQFE